MEPILSVGGDFNHDGHQDIASIGQEAFGTFWLSILCLPINSAFMLVQPYLLKLAIDRHVAVGDPNGLTKIGVLYVGAILGECVSFYIQYYLFIDSHLGYGPAMSVNALLAPLIGGAGTVLGPLIGAVALGSLAEVTSLLLGKQPGVNLLAFGVLLLVILRFLPNGLMGLFRGRS